LDALTHYCLRTAGGRPSEIRVAADIDKSGIAASRHPEKANAVAVDLRGARPCTKHEIDQALDVGRAFERDRHVVDAAPVESAVATMVDRCDHKACVSESCCRIMMAADPSGHAMRDNDERKPAS
jgi:hypothetical protein